jgi:hypothetical protein
MTAGSTTGDLLTLVGSGGGLGLVGELADEGQEGGDEVLSVRLGPPDRHDFDRTFVLWQVISPFG